MFNADFYPTPKILINKMLSKVDLNKVKTILEPSCWKWDIIEAIKEKCYWYRPKIYWIEIEHQLRELVKNKCEIIWYDFLEFNNTMINFDLIIANFPFSNWVKHFLKAWELLWKGDLVCLVNAETIKNPFSKERQLMLEILENNNAEIEYIENAFIEAERKTSVEVALIKITKIKTNYSNIFEWFKEQFYNEFTNLDWDIKQNEIVVWNDKVDHIIKLNIILKKEAINVAIAKNKYSYYNSIFSDALLNKWLIEKKEDDKSIISDITEEIFTINQKCWSYFFRITPLRSKLTNKTYQNFIEEYQNSKIDFTYENIHRVTEIIKLNAWKIQEENYIEIFDYLTKYREDNRIHIEWWKTNSWYQLNKRFIIPRWVDYSRDKPRFQREFKEKLDDIDTVFCNLTWKDFNNIKQTRDFFENHWETEFFELKTYKKWTVHFKVKDEYLENLKNFNLIVCKSKKWIWF